MRRRLAVPAALALALALALPATVPAAAGPKAGTYKGKIAHQGYEVTFKVKRGRVTDLVARVLQDCGSGLQTFLIAPDQSWPIKRGRVSGKKVDRVGQASAHVTLEGRFTGSTFKGSVREWDVVEGSGIVCDTLRRTFTAKRR